MSAAEAVCMVRTDANGALALDPARASRVGQIGASKESGDFFQRTRRPDTTPLEGGFADSQHQCQTAHEADRERRKSQSQKPHSIDMSSQRKRV